MNLLRSIVMILALLVFDAGAWAQEMELYCPSCDARIHYQGRYSTGHQPSCPWNKAEPTRRAARTSTPVLPGYVFHGPPAKQPPPPAPSATVPSSLVRDLRHLRDRWAAHAREVGPLQRDAARRELKGWFEAPVEVPTPAWSRAPTIQLGAVPRLTRRSALVDELDGLRRRSRTLPRIDRGGRTLADARRERMTVTPGSFLDDVELVLGERVREEIGSILGQLADDALRALGAGAVVMRVKSFGDWLTGRVDQLSTEALTLVDDAASALGDPLATDASDLVDRQEELQWDTWDAIHERLKEDLR